MTRLAQARCLPFLGAVLAGCFPTFQNARVEPGFRLDANVTLLDDQARNGTPQGKDILPFLIPAYGFGRRVELGLPVGLYAEEGLHSGPINEDRNALLVMPYVKFGLLDEASPHHLALIGQTAFFVPANIGVRYGRDLGDWEPHIGFNWIMSGGEAGDDPTVTRYQERNQTLFSLSVGATLDRPRNAAIEVGILRNRYDEFIASDPLGGRFVPVTYYDLYAGLRLQLAGRR
jgi:hypothetical protein